MAKVIIIGGGLAGLSAAVNLCSSHNVVVIEQNDRLGGKIKHAYDQISKTYFDIGQHLLLSAYNSTEKYLNIINPKTNFFEISKIKFFSDNQIYDILLPKNHSSFLLLKNILKSNLFDTTNLLEFIFNSFYIAINKNLKKKENKVYNFLNLFAVSIFNTNIENIDSDKLKNTFKLILKRNNFIPLLPISTLENILVEPAKKYLLYNNTEIRLKERVQNLVIENNIVKKILTNNNLYDKFDYVIFALPFNELSKLLNLKILVKMNDILTIYLFSNYNLDVSMIGNLQNNPDWDWMFSYNNIISFVKSNYKNNKIYIEQFMKNAKSLLNNNALEIVNYKVIKYKNATPIQDKDFVENTNNLNQLKNAYFAGDWVYKNMPCTIETAIKSGLQIKLDN